MNNEGGKTWYGIGIDNSGLQSDAEESARIISNIGSKAEAEGSRIDSAMGKAGASMRVTATDIKNAIENIPKLEIDVTAARNADDIAQAYRQIDSVVNENRAAIEVLETEIKRLTADYSNLFQTNNDEAQKLRPQIQVMKESVRVRQEVIQAAKSTEAQLKQVERANREEAEAAAQSVEKHVSLRTRLRELREELVAMEAAGMRGTEAYRALQEEAGMLTDRMGDAAKQASVLANDQRGFQGVLSGLTGLTGAFTAASGVVAIFGDKNEELQAIMLRVQSLMSITMGLQQVQAALDKDSAFSLVTLNGLKDKWAKILAVARGQEVAETTATAANTTAQKANAAATATNTTSTTANAAATEAKAVAKDVSTVAQEAATAATELNATAVAADTVATEANAVASGEAAVATGAEATAQTAETAAAVAGTAANFTLAGAFRAVGVAIASIPVFGWIAAAIGAIIAAVAYFSSEANEAEEQMKRTHEAINEAEGAAAQSYAKVSLELEHLKSKVDNFNGSREDEKALCDELNSKYGDELGYYDDIASWKTTLAECSEYYTKMLMEEARAQAFLNEYTKAYVEAMKGNDYDANMAIAEKMKYYYEDALFGAELYGNIVKTNLSLNRKYGNVKPRQQGGSGSRSPRSSSRSGSSSKSSDAPRFDAAKAKEAEEKALEDYEKQREKFLKQINNDYMRLYIEQEAHSLTKQLNTITNNTRERKQALKESFQELAESYREYEKKQFLATGKSEQQWEATDVAKMNIDAYIERLKKTNENFKQAADEFEKQDKLIGEDEARQIKAAKDAYQNEHITNFGSLEQRLDQLKTKWIGIFSFLPDEFRDEAKRQWDAEEEAIEKQFSNRTFEALKKSINWEAVFGDMSKQSLPALQTELDQLNKNFPDMKDKLDVNDLKAYQEAITKLENEIAARNPYTAFLKSVKDVKVAQGELTTALEEQKKAEEALDVAQEEVYNAKTEAVQLAMDGVPNDDERAIAAAERLKEAEEELARAKEKVNQSDTKVATAQNKVVTSYKKVASQLVATGKSIKDIGGKAKNLAKVFSDNISDGIDKALDLMGEMIDVSSELIGSIGEVTKKTTKNIADTADAASAATKGTAQATATAISTVEKASIILTVISAALQVATAIANLFNNDDSKQKEIEKLQQRIDQLQWELDNEDTLRLQERVGDAMERLKAIYEETTEAVIMLHSNSKEYADFWTREVLSIIHSNTIVELSVKKLADAYAQVSYAADKALGEEKYASARKRLENLAEQQVLVYKQLQEEEDKKKTDSDKVAEYKRTIQELAEEMASVVNSALEEIIGGSAEDIAQQLGDAFIEAAAQGENAMKAWGDTAKDIIRSVLKQMIVSKFLEEPLGQIFDKYKKKWFGDEGNFKGIDAVITSMTEFSSDLDALGNNFNDIWGQLPDSVTSMFKSATEQDTSQRGFATASQDSIDELNGRFTAVQMNTENIKSNLQMLVENANNNRADIANINSNMTELQTLSLIAVDHLESISKNTHELYEMNERLDKIERNTRNI